MTTPTVINLYGVYLTWSEDVQLKELSELTIEDILEMRKIESETARELEAERQIDEMLILAENN